MDNEEVEKAMLFYIIFGKEQFDLTEKDFINPTNKKIIQAINKLNAKKQDVSMLTIENEINENDKKILTYLSTLGDFISGSNSETIYKILKEHTKKRELISLTSKIKDEIQTEDNIDLYIEKVISELQNIEFQTKKEEDFTSQVIKTVSLIERNITKEKDYSFYTGYFDLDALTDGLHEGEFTVIGARPRSWKNNICVTAS